MNATRIKELMKEKGLTQKALGELVGVSHVMIGYILSGLKIPSLSTLIAIANALECTVDEIVVRE